MRKRGPAEAGPTGLIQTSPSAEVEFERYEMRERAVHHFELQRRDFFKAMGGGIAILVAVRAPLATVVAAQESGGRGDAASEEIPETLGPGCMLARMAASASSPEKWRLGRTSALRSRRRWRKNCACRLASIRMTMGDTAKVPFDMGTFGSRSTPTMGLQLRRAAVYGKRCVDRSRGERNGEWGARDWWRKTRACAIRAPGRTASYAELATGQQFSRDDSGGRSVDCAGEVDHCRKIDCESRGAGFCYGRSIAMLRILCCRECCTRKS